jgi:dihydrofolate reductase
MQQRMPEGVFSVQSLEEGLELARSRGEEELMVIGGGKLYEAAIGEAQSIYLTHVLTRIKEEGVLFPVVSALDWEIVSSEYREKDEKNPFPMEFLELRRKGVSV